MGMRTISIRPVADADSFHKPAWSPERLWGQDFLGSMITYRSSLVRSAVVERTEQGGLDPASELHQFALAVTRRASVIVHVPVVLHHRAPESIPRCGRPSSHRSGALRPHRTTRQGRCRRRCDGLQPAPE